MQIEIGYWWLGEDITNNTTKEIEGIFWWGICKRTKKVALIGTSNFYPIACSSTHISNGECFDGSSCLNIDCPYAESKNLISAINKSPLKGMHPDDILIKFFENAFKDIENYFDEMDDDKIIKCFIDDCEYPTITEHVFERILPGD